MSFQDSSLTQDVSAVPTREPLCGFASGTRILSQGQNRQIETLKKGDLVDTRDNGSCAITQVHTYPVPVDMVDPHLVRFHADAMGPGLPKSPVVMCAHQPIMLDHIGLKMVFGTSQMLTRARTMVNSGNVIKVHSAAPMHLYQIECAEQQIIFANGLSVATYRPSENYRLKQAGLYPKHRCTVPCGDRGTFGKPVRPMLKDFEVDAILAK